MKLVVSVLLDSLVTRSQTSVFPRLTVTLGHLYPNVAPMKFGMNVAANVLRDFAVIPTKATA